MSAFDDLVRALEPALRSVAPFTATRLVLRARIYDREHMTLTQLAGIRTQLAEGLGEVLSGADLQTTLTRIDALIAQPAGGERRG